VQFGQGQPLKTDEAMNVVLDRAMEKLRSVVDQARKDLGLPEGTALDTSPDGTADRIVTFALGAFEKYAKNHGLENDEAGRSQFASFIGDAINQGITEARGILTALNSLSGEVDGNITKTWDIIQQRLDDFVSKGLSTS
jgi:hypothetical protein